MILFVAVHVVIVVVHVVIAIIIIIDIVVVVVVAVVVYVVVAIAFVFAAVSFPVDGMRRQKRFFAAQPNRRNPSHRRPPSQVCQMVFFKPKIQIWANFGGSCNGRCWYILWKLGPFYGLLLHFMDS
jgi:hypothetical protein